MTPIFNCSRKYPGMHAWCKFGNSSPNLWRDSARTSRISQISDSQWPKWPSRSRSITLIFDNSEEYPMMHVWCKFGNSSSNLWGVIMRTRSSLRTDGQTDGWTQATTLPLRSERPWGKNWFENLAFWLLSISMAIIIQIQMLYCINRHLSGR